MTDSADSADAPGHATDLLEAAMAENPDREHLRRVAAAERAQCDALDAITVAERAVRTTRIAELADQYAAAFR